MPEPEKLAVRSTADRTSVRSTESVEALVAKWHFESFHGTRLANDTELWNLVHAAAGDLSARLAALMKEI